MISTNKLNDINKIYHQPQNVTAGAPSADEDKPSPVMPVDRVTLSRHALDESAQGRAASRSAGEQDLTPEEQEVVNDLKQRDAEVKAHEQAHMTAGGGIAGGGATYQYQSGPDGKMYAIGGEVQIDLSTEGSPEATIRKMQQVQAAALAPAQPSGADRSVAAQAAQIEAMAHLEKTQKKEEAAESAPNQALPEDDYPSGSASPFPLDPTGGHVNLMA